MKVHIKGESKHLDKNRAREAIKFYAKILMPRLVDKITIFLSFKHMKNDYEIANCSWSDDNRRPREFEIEVNNSMSVRKTLMAIAHEMVHVKQYARGELVDHVRSSKVSFKGKVYNHPSPSFEDDYWDAPWEIEAFGRELGLYLRYMEYEKKLKKTAEAK